MIDIQSNVIRGGFLSASRCPLGKIRRTCVFKLLTKILPSSFHSLHLTLLRHSVYNAVKSRPAADLCLSAVTIVQRRRIILVTASETSHLECGMWMGSYWDRRLSRSGWSQRNITPCSLFGFVLVTSVSICKTTKQSKPDSLQVCDVVKTQIKSILEHLYYFRVCIILKRTFSLQNIN